MNAATTSQKLLSRAALEQARGRRYAARKRVNQVALTLSLAAMAFGVFWLVWILWETLRLGLGGLSLSLFTEMTPPPNEAGGLANEFAEAGEGLHQASLIYLGLVLFFITFVVLSASKLLLSRLQKAEGARA